MSVLWIMEYLKVSNRKAIVVYAGITVVLFLALIFWIVKLEVEISTLRKELRTTEDRIK
jgi:hypothetical protein